jgi:hypothetical protein
VADDSNQSPTANTAKRPRAMRWLVIAIVAAVAFWWWAHESTDPVFGRYEGDVIAKWITDDLEMELVQDFNYVDPSGKRWKAPAGSVINGASIPSMFWSVIGGPFEGRFRKASVLHDSACEVQGESWEDVHRMFYDACRCSRVGIGKAQTMYWAVYHFGPRWENSRTTDATPPAEPLPDESIVAKAERYFDKKEFTPKEIEECTVEQVEAEVARWDAAKGAAEGK